MKDKANFGRGSDEGAMWSGKLAIVYSNSSKIYCKMEAKLSGTRSS